MISSLELWERRSREWDHFGPPLRPSIQDIDLFERLLTEYSGNTLSPAIRAVLLGVTPEIAIMRWPSHTRLLAVDRNMAMIRNVWPGSKVPGAKVVCARWAAMPIADGSCDVVISDGCFCLLAYPDGYSTLFQEIRRVLKPGGILVTRNFVRPNVPEKVEAVLKDLWERRIGNFHVFKWRLNMALHSDISNGVRHAEVWNAWHKAVPDPAILVSELNWPLEAISTIDCYRDNDACRTFPTVNELREALSPYFVETDRFFPDYELGERCPIMNLQVRE
jgi:SAM-dependent methyltransferase